MNACPGLNWKPKTAKSVDQVCSSEGISASLRSRCGGLVGLSADQAQNIVEQITPEEVITMGTTAVETANFQFTNVMDRILDLRAGHQGGINVAGLPLYDGKKMLAMAGEATDVFEADDLADTFKRLGTFITGNMGFGDKDRTVNEAGYDFNTRGITAAVDYAFTNDFIFGAAFGYARTEAIFDRNSGRQKNGGLVTSVFGKTHCPALADIRT